MTIITILRQSGSLGTIIAKALKKELKLDYLDKINLGFSEEFLQLY